MERGSVVFSWVLYQLHFLDIPMLTSTLIDGFPDHATFRETILYLATVRENRSQIFVNNVARMVHQNMIQKGVYLLMSSGKIPCYLSILNDYLN